MILAVLYGTIEFLRGGYTSVVVALYMDVCNPRVGATQFSILTSLANVGTTAGNTVSGSLVTLLGFGRVFLYSAWCFGPALILLYFIRFKNIVRKKKINSTK
jgi:predicted MFS family arabinose efflux permease